MRQLLVIIVGLALTTVPGFAANQTPNPSRSEFAASVCEATVREAAGLGLDGTFFVRLLWKESLFDPNAVSPKGAQGLAQFMPETAAIRGLADPFDPLPAVAASAAYLSELKATFGNLGLAAAAYNAGEERVRRWLAGKGGMPLETRDYVAFITGHDIEAWRDPKSSHPIAAAQASADLKTDCVNLALRLKSPAGPALRQARRMPWGALIASHFSQARALAMYRRLKLRAPEVLANVDPMLVRKRNLSRGTRPMTLVFAGSENRAGASVLCDRLQAAGVPCRVLKTR